MDKWNCFIAKHPETLTVGEKFSLSCRGEKPVTFNENLKVVFPQKENSYRLHILKGVQGDSNSLDLQVVAWRTGDFQNIPFVITDGESQVLVENLSFSVKSVLTEKSKAPHPPFGPWKSPILQWQLYCLVLAFLLLLLATVIFFKIFFKRKRFIEKIRARRSAELPGKTFARCLREIDIDSPDYVSALDRLFRIFLEDMFFVPALEKPSEVILKHLKRYNRSLYKVYGSKIKAVLNGLNEFKNKQTSKSLCQEFKINCLELVFDLEKET